MLAVRNWAKYYENNRTKELVKARWFPCPNSQDGSSYCELLDHKNGERHYAAWISILAVASKCTPRGTLRRENGEEHTAATISRQTRISLKTLEEAIPRLVKIGWIEQSNPAPLPQVYRTHIAPSCDIPAPTSHLPAPRARVGMEENGIEGMEGNGKERNPAPPTELVCVPKVVAFTPDAERFSREYPTQVNQLASQYFCQICKTPEIEDKLFGNLEQWKRSDQWKRGMVKAAKAWLSEGDWEILPKEVPKSATKQSGLNETLQWLAGRDQ